MFLLVEGGSGNSRVADIQSCEDVNAIQTLNSCAVFPVQTQDAQVSAQLHRTQAVQKAGQQFATVSSQLLLFSVSVEATRDRLEEVSEDRAEILLLH
jgi:hypothetical protein